MSLSCNTSVRLYFWRRIRLDNGIIISSKGILSNNYRNLVEKSATLLFVRISQLESN